MEVDSLVVSLGLDSQDFRAALNQVLAMLIRDCGISPRALPKDVKML